MCRNPKRRGLTAGGLGALGKDKSRSVVVCVAYPHAASDAQDHLLDLSVVVLGDELGHQRRVVGGDLGLRFPGVDAA